jgi:hypothetical protein
MNSRTAWLLAMLLLAVMGGLMIGAARQDSATVDEANELATGYVWWKGLPTRLGSGEHPPLSRLVAAAPLLGMEIKLCRISQALVRGELAYPWTLSWKGTIRPVKPLLVPACKGSPVQIPPLGDPLIYWQCPAVYPMDNWYFTPVPEEQMFGKVLLYGEENNGDAMLLAGRVMAIIQALFVGGMIFFWARHATGQMAPAVMALALWCFNPTALAYGHLIKNDIGVTLGIILSLYLFTRFIESPSGRSASLWGMATGFSLTMKLTTLLLGPVFLVALLIAWSRSRPNAGKLMKLAGAFVGSGWLVTVLILFPWAAPAPEPTILDRSFFELPRWFTVLRPVLVPAELFKSIAQAFGHSQGGTESYLLGQWKQGGWWYYFPVAFLLKSSVAFVLLAGWALALFGKHIRSTRPSEWVLWIGAGGYLLLAMTSGINIGVRHLLPMVALLCVAIGCAFGRVRNRPGKVAWVTLAGWQTGVALLAFPLYLQFFSELTGGGAQGHRYLLDSNFDWGQDARRLKQYLEANKIGHIYLDYYGNQFSTEFHKITNTRVTAETARQIHQGTLVVSASQLMRPEWNWLRQSRQPSARVAHTLFVYQFP